MDTRVNTVERRALTVRDLNLNLMQIRYSATPLRLRNISSTAFQVGIDESALCVCL